MHSLDKSENRHETFKKTWNIFHVCPSTFKRKVKKMDLFIPRELTENQLNRRHERCARYYSPDLKVNQFGPESLLAAQSGFSLTRVLAKRAVIRWSWDSEHHARQTLNSNNVMIIAYFIYNTVHQNTRLKWHSR